MIYLTSDWHLIKWHDGVEVIQRDVLETVLSELEGKNEYDQLIFMGDMFDAEIDPRRYADICEMLKEKISRMYEPIFIRGNNDTLCDNDYKKFLGFHKVVFGSIFTVRKKRVLISHTSVRCDGIVDYDVHGHIHRPNTDPDDIPYYHQCGNNINICTKDRREIRLTSLTDIDFEEEAKRNITYDPSKQEKPGMSQFVQRQVYDIFDSL